MSGGGSEQGLMEGIVKCVDYIDKKTKDKPRMLFPLKASDQDFGPGTVNHAGLRCVLSWIMALLYSTDIQAHEQRLLSFFHVQEVRGHCCKARTIETSSASHIQLHYAYAAAALLFAYKFDRFIVIAAVQKWFSDEIRLALPCALPISFLGNNGYSPRFHSPGWRAIQGEEKTLVTINSGRDIFLERIFGGYKPTQDQLQNKYNLGVRCAVILGRIRPAESELKVYLDENRNVAVPYDFEVYARDKSDWYAGFIAPSNPDLCLTTGLVDNKMITIPDKTLHEIDLTGFDLKVRYEATPWSIKNRTQIGD